MDELLLRPIHRQSGLLMGLKSGTTDTAQAIEIVNGSVMVVDQSIHPGEDVTNNVVKVEQRFSFSHFSTVQTLTVIKATPGFLHSVSINTKGTVASVVSIYDSNGAATNAIAIIDSLALS